VAILSRIWFTIGELLPLALVPVLPAAGPSEPVPVTPESSGGATR
jgi:hypothetical protein